MSDLSAFKSLVDKRYETYSVMKRKYGIIKEVLSYAKAIVTLEDKDMTDIQEYYRAKEKERKQLEAQGLTIEDDDPFADLRNLTLLNKTGEVLEVGDAVWVYYWHDLSSGYIAIRCGVSDGTTRAKYTVERVGIMPSSTATSSDIFIHARVYDPEVWEWGMRDKMWVVDDKHNLIFYRGQTSGDFYPYAFFVNGFPVASVTDLDDFFNGGMTPYYRELFFNQLNTINSGMFSRKIILNCYHMGVNRNRTYVKLSGELTFAPKVYYSDSYGYYEDLAVTYNGITYDCPTAPVSYDYDIPYYTTAEEAAGSSKIVVISNMWYADSLDYSIELAIGIKYKSGAWRIAGSYLHSYMNRFSFIGAYFASEDEFYYAVAVSN